MPLLRYTYSRPPWYIMRWVTSPPGSSWCTSFVRPLPSHCSAWSSCDTFSFRFWCCVWIRPPFDWDGCCLSSYSMRWWMLPSSMFSQRKKSIGLTTSTCSGSFGRWSKNVEKKITIISYILDLEIDRRKKKMTISACHFDICIAYAFWIYYHYSYLFHKCVIY